MKSKTLSDEIVLHLPDLKRYSLKLTAGVKDRAEDLVQDTILKALTYSDSFQPGTNAIGWLITIMKHHFFSDRLMMRNRAPHYHDWDFSSTQVDPVQEFVVDGKRAAMQLTTLPKEESDMIAKAALGYTYEDLAEEANVAVGTIKSRMHRSKKRLGWI